MWVPWMQQVVFLAKPEELPSRSKQTGLREDDFGSGKSFKNTVLQNSVGKKKKKKRLNLITCCAHANPAEAMILYLNLQLPRIMRSRAT